MTPRSTYRPMASQHHSPIKRQTQSNAESEDPLGLNPGVPERKRRSASRFCYCLWWTVIVSAFAGIVALYYIFSKEMHYLQHPHHWSYVKKPDSEITDWSDIVRPMITQDDLFDIFASVWVQDNEGKAGGLYIDGEERPETLLYSETLFRNLSFKSRDKFTNVTLRLPTNHL